METVKTSWEVALENLVEMCRGQADPALDTARQLAREAAAENLRRFLECAQQDATDTLDKP